MSIFLFLLGRIWGSENNILLFLFVSQTVRLNNSSYVFLVICMWLWGCYLSRTCSDFCMCVTVCMWAKQCKCQGKGLGTIFLGPSHAVESLQLKPAEAWQLRLWVKVIQIKKGHQALITEESLMLKGWGLWAEQGFSVTTLTSSLWLWPRPREEPRCWGLYLLYEAISPSQRVWNKEHYS